jgi:hypothetical protein
LGAGAAYLRDGPLYELNEYGEEIRRKGISP